VKCGLGSDELDWSFKADRLVEGSEMRVCEIAGQRSRADFEWADADPWAGAGGVSHRKVASTPRQAIDVL